MWLCVVTDGGGGVAVSLCELTHLEGNGRMFFFWREKWELNIAMDIWSQAPWSVT